jgi:hypothetical protein
MFADPLALAFNKYGRQIERLAVWKVDMTRKPEGAHPPEGCSLQDSAKTSSSGGSSINFMIRLLDIFS